MSIRLKLPSASRLKTSFASAKLRELKILNDGEVLSVFDINTDAVNKNDESGIRTHAPEETRLGRYNPKVWIP